MKVKEVYYEELRSLVNFNNVTIGMLGVVEKGETEDYVYEKLKHKVRELIKQKEIDGDWLLRDRKQQLQAVHNEIEEGKKQLSEIRNSVMKMEGLAELMKISGKEKYE